MEVYAAQIDRMDQGIGRILARAGGDRPARQHARHLPRRQRRLRRGHPRGRDDRRAGRQADDREVAHAQRRAGALRQRSRPHAGPGEHLPELRPGLGQPVEHAVPPLQALDPRGRHRDAADRPLAGGHRATRARSATRRATCPTSWRRSSSDRHALSRRVGRPEDRAARRHIAGAGVRARRRRAAADVLGARRQRGGAHRQVEAGAQLSRAMGALRHGGRPNRAARPRGPASRARRRHGARSTRRGRSAAACSTARRS